MKKIVFITLMLCAGTMLMAQSLDTIKTGKPFSNNGLKDGERMSQAWAKTNAAINYLNAHTYPSMILSGTLALGTNSITMTGSIGATGARVTKGWFTNLEVTNLPTVGGASLSALYTSGDIALGANNITMTGSIAATGNRVTKGWFTNVESTNAPTVSGVSIFTNPTLTSLAVGVDTVKGVQATKAVTSVSLLRATAAGTIGGFSGGRSGQLLVIVNTTATTLKLTHNGAGTQKIMISGAADLTMTGQYNSVTLIFDGTDWFVVGKGQ
jgi:hypothetical protein